MIPPSLRERVLCHLHAAHQGAPVMEQHARAIVYWQGMSTSVAPGMDVQTVTVTLRHKQLRPLPALLTTGSPV